MTDSVENFEALTAEQATSAGGRGTVELLQKRPPEDRDQAHARTP